MIEKFVVKHSKILKKLCIWVAKRGANVTSTYHFYQPRQPFVMARYRKR